MLSHSSIANPAFPVALTLKDKAELFVRSLPPEFAKWRRAHLEELRVNHLRIQQRAFDLLASFGSRVAALPNSMAEELRFRAHNEPHGSLEPDEIALRSLEPRCQPCPFCPPYNLPLDAIIPEGLS